jgi:hypothetical protein
MSAEDADRARATIARSEPEMMWLPVIGLDRHTPLIGLRPVADLASARPAEDGGGVRVQPAIYHPITRVYSAPSIHLEINDR